MSDIAATTNGDPMTKPFKASRRQKVRKERKPRVTDPGVLEIKREASERIREFHKAAASARLLNKILKDYLPRLTAADQETLHCCGNDKQ